jgi:CHAT domain-containing protein
MAPLLLGLLLTTKVDGYESLGLQSCEEAFAARPQAEEPAKCFYKGAHDPPSTAAAVHALRGLLAQHPRLPWLSFYLGSLEWGRPEAAEFYRAAAGWFAESGEVGGEFRARYNLYNQLNYFGHAEEAAFEKQRAVSLAKASRTPALVADANILETLALLKSGRDLGGSGKFLAEAERTLFPDGSANQQMDWLSASGEVYLQIGRLDDAQQSFGRLEKLASPLDDSYKLAAAQDGLMRVLMERAAERPSDFGPELILLQARGALARAQLARDANAEFRVQFVLGLLTRGEESRDHFARCVMKSATPARASFCRGGWARKLAEEDSKQAQEVLSQARAEIEKSEDPWLRPYFLGDQMRVSWSTRPHEQALTDSWAALNAVEALRRVQGPGSQAGLFSTWSDDYYWFSGSLLARTNPSSDDVEQAFAVTEHLRARTVLEKLADVRPEFPSKEMLAKRLLGMNTAIENVKRRVNDAQLPIREQKNAQEDLAALTSERGEVERQLKLSASPEPETKFATLDEVYHALAPDEALLSFQVAPQKDWTGAFGGGSWLTVLTREARQGRKTARIYPLPGREELRRLVDRLRGLLESSETEPEEPRNLFQVYQQLLAPALADLPVGVRRLVILPDDDLHKLPFAALRPAAEGPPLSARYQITVAPSATLWLHWRRTPPAEPAALPALVLADPVRLDEHLSRLPRSAREGREVLDALGGGILRLREEAAEAFLKNVDLHPVGILHLATHSVVDEENPEHSSIRLTPSPGGKGHFEVADILGLEKHGMEGKVVVLSTCESARGQILRGEGVMSLARAFFQAGAHTVVASLWNVDDRDGMKLFERFYHYLGQGASVAAALRAAQRDRIADGAPVAAWAAFVVLGDGDLVPLPGGRWQAWLPSWLSAWRLASAGVALSALLGFGFWWRRRPPFPS